MGEEEDPAKAALQLASETTWCIEFLDKQLEGGKLSEKRMKELRKAKKLLKAENTPLPQRRQVMRTQCGDYRAKMKAEEEAVKLDASKVTFNDVNVVSRILQHSRAKIAKAAETKHSIWMHL